jgi:Neuraminidase (sialidase)
MVTSLVNLIKCDMLLGANDDDRDEECDNDDEGATTNLTGGEDGGWEGTMTVVAGREEEAMPVTMTMSVLSQGRKNDKESQRWRRNVLVYVAAVFRKLVTTTNILGRLLSRFTKCSAS